MPPYALSCVGLAVGALCLSLLPEMLPSAAAAVDDEAHGLALLAVAVKGSVDGEVEVVFEPVTARYVRLVGYSEATGNDLQASAAEIRLLATDGTTPLDRERWKVVDASNQSQESARPADRALDGDPKTTWLSPGQPPHYVDLDLGQSLDFAGLRYVPAKDLAGQIHRFGVFVSDDGVRWGHPIIQGVLMPRADGVSDDTRDRPLPVQMRRTVFAASELVQAPVAICLDEQNRVFVAETNRYEGRGVIDNRGKPRRELDDLKTNTLEEREATLKQWLADGELALELQKRQDAFGPGDDFFSKYSEQVALLEDLDGDGVADRRSIFADGFNEMLTGTGAGVLAIDGDVYYTCIPNLWKLRDEDGNGRADHREILSRGYGVRTGWYGHDLHGLTLGSDGRIYFSMADRGFHVVTKEEKLLHGPGTGGVFRCWPDGSGLELFARGLRNPQELAFDDFGNLFTGDNNCDAGDKARLVYVAEEGDSGWDMCVQSLADRGPWMREHMWELRKEPRDPSQPAWIIPPVAHINSGPSGFAAYPGSGLPERYDGYFFLCDYRGGRGSIQAFTVEPRGAGFDLLGHHTFDDGPTVSDVTFGYDGKLYVAEWGPGWDVNPHARIYTLSHEPSQAEPIVREVEALFREGFRSRSDAELAGFLGHRDRRVRLRAQFALAERTALAVLQGAFADDSRRMARLHALWGIGQMARHSEEARRVLASVAASESDVELRAQALRLCGEWKIAEAGSAALERLKSLDEPRLAYHAAMAVGRLAPAGAREALLALLEANDDRDVYLRHAAVVSLARLNQVDTLLDSVKDSSSVAVRLATVLVLRRLDDSRVATFLQDPSPAVVTEAARAIYDREIQGALPALARALTESPVSEEAFLRRALEANLRLGSEESAERLCAFASREEAPREKRLLALELLLQWDDPAPRDGVWGKWRPLTRAVAGSAKAPVRKHLPAWLQSSDGQLLSLAQRLDQAVGQEKTPEQLAAFVEDTKRAEGLRMEALLALEKKKTEAPVIFERTCRSAREALEAPRLRALALRGWVRLKGIDEAFDAVRNVIREGTTVQERQSAVLALEGESGPQVEQFVKDSLQALGRGEMDQAIGLELLQLAEDSPSPSVRQSAADYRAQGSQALHVLALEGGDHGKGKEIYETNLAAQCMRCHAVKGKGGDVGPPLDGVGKRDGAFLLASIVDPQKDVSMGYGLQTVTMKNGNLFSGVLMAEDEQTVSLKTDLGVETLDKGEIRERTKPISGMPPMGSLLKPRELRDLIAYLKTLR